MSQAANLIASGLIAFWCVAGVLSCKFADTLLQRIALGVACLGAMATCWYCNTNPLPGGIELLLWGAAAFATATAHKLSQPPKTAKKTMLQDEDAPENQQPMLF